MESDTNIHREMVSAVDVASYQENEFWVVWKSDHPFLHHMVCNILEHYNLGVNIFGQSEMFGRVVDLIPKTEIPDISKNPDNSYIRDIFSAMIRGRISQ